MREWGSWGKWNSCLVCLGCPVSPVCLVRPVSPTRRLAARRNTTCRWPDSKRSFNRLCNCALYRDVVAEANFSLCRMDIDVDLVWRQFDEKEKCGLYVALSMRICLAHCVGNRRRGRRASVHEYILVAPRRHREIWLFYVARDAYDIFLCVRRWRKGNQALDEVGAEDVEQTVGE